MIEIDETGLSERLKEYNLELVSCESTKIDNELVITIVAKRNVPIKSINISFGVYEDNVNEVNTIRN